MPREATSSDRGQLAGLDRPHEHVPLGRRELHQVACLADADLALIDLDARARVAVRAKRDALLDHRRSPPFICSRPREIGVRRRDTTAAWPLAGGPSRASR